MTDTPDDKEELLQAVASLMEENEQLRAEATRSSQLLRGLEALLSVEGHEDPFRNVFASLWSTFAFKQAMVLIEAGDGELRCAVGEPAALEGSRWPIGKLFDKVLKGRVSAVFSHAGLAEWGGAGTLALSPDQPALYMPVRVRQRRGILVLLRAPGEKGFDHREIALGRKFSLLASHALAALTDRQAIEASRAQALAAEEASLAKNMFLANMSHELRTPLNAIIGFSQLMERGVLGAIGVPAYAGYVSDIRSSGEHLLAIVDNLLLLSRIEAGQHRPHIEPVALADALAGALRLLEIDLQRHGVRLSLEPIAPQQLVCVDPVGLRQILVNVIGNAAKFSERGGEIAIRMEGTPGDSACRLMIRDRGCGMPPETLAQIGRPFVQAENSYVRGYQGTGLGLAISCRLAEAMGGALIVESEVGQGTTVSLSLRTESRGNPAAGEPVGRHSRAVAERQLAG